MLYDHMGRHLLGRGTGLASLSTHPAQVSDLKSARAHPAFEIGMGCFSMK